MEFKLAVERCLLAECWGCDQSKFKVRHEDCCDLFNNNKPGEITRIGRFIIIIIIFINCNWVVTRWKWLFYMYAKYETIYY